MDNIVPYHLVQETEDKKKGELKTAFEFAFDDIMSQDIPCKHMTHFFILFFLKFTPHDKLFQYDTMDKTFKYIPRTLCYYARITCPDPQWGTELYIVEAATGKNACVWALPALARNSPQFTKEMGLNTKRPKVAQSVIEMLSGTLNEKCYQHNNDPFIVRQVEDLMKKGLIRSCTS